MEWKSLFKKPWAGLFSVCGSVGYLLDFMESKSAMQEIMPIIASVSPPFILAFAVTCAVWLLFQFWQWLAERREVAVTRRRQEDKRRAENVESMVYSLWSLFRGPSIPLSQFFSHHMVSEERKEEARILVRHLESVGLSPAHAEMTQDWARHLDRIKVHLKFYGLEQTIVACSDWKSQADNG